MALPLPLGLAMTLEAEGVCPAPATPSLGLPESWLRAGSKFLVNTCAQDPLHNACLQSGPWIRHKARAGESLWQKGLCVGHVPQALRPTQQPRGRAGDPPSTPEAPRLGPGLCPDQAPCLYSSWPLACSPFPVFYFICDFLAHLNSSPQGATSGWEVNPTALGP